MKKKIITLNESDIVRIVKRVLKEQTMVSGPYKPLNLPIGELFIIKTDKVTCMDRRSTPTRNQIIVATNNVCPTGYLTIPANKFFISDTQRNQDGSLRVMSPDQGEYYTNATNNGQGYNSEEEAKQGLSKIMNPQGVKGRQVEKNQYGKQVTKYNQKGDLKSVKQNYNYTNQQGQQVVSKTKTSSGL